MRSRGYCTPAVIIAMELYKHNEEAYKAVVRMLKREGKAAVIHPTGTGKSFIGFKLCECNKRKRFLWLCPSKYIYDMQVESWIKAGGEELRNIHFISYMKLSRLADEDIYELKPDYIVLDEFHRCGAKHWNKSVNRLIKIYQDARLVGFSATSVRFLDNRRDMADELFDGYVASEISLGSAIVRGILKAPRYVTSVYSIENGYRQIEETIKNNKSKAAKDKARDYCNKLRRALDRAEGLNIVFKRHMNPAGKYLVFCSSYIHMMEMMELAGEWFCEIDSDPHLYYAYKNCSFSKRQFDEFKGDKSEHLKIMYCIGMFNEGVHIPDVEGVVLLRPTTSPVVFKQQIGRALSASKCEEPIIFDIVLNLNNLYSIQAVEEEMVEALAVYKRENPDKPLIEKFSIVDEVCEVTDIVKRINQILGATWSIMYASAVEYYKEHGSLKMPKNYTTKEGYSLGSWLSIQRRVRAGKIKGILTQTQIEKLDRLEMRWETYEEMDFSRKYEIARRYYNLHGNLNISARFITADGVALGKWICKMRVFRRNNSSRLSEEKIRMLDNIGMVWDVTDYRWQIFYQAAQRYYSKYGNLNVPTYYTDDEGVLLGRWISAQRMYRKRGAGTLMDWQVNLLDDMQMDWNGIKQNTWQKATEELELYIKEHGTSKVPIKYVTQDGFKLGIYLSKHRDRYKNAPDTNPRKAWLIKYKVLISENAM